MSNESVFVRELKNSIIHHAVEKGLAPPVCVKLHGSPILSSMPDILVQHPEKGTMFIECKVRPMPKRSFNLFQGVTDNQRGMMRALREAGGLVYLAVRLGNKDMLLVKLDEIMQGFSKGFIEYPIDPKQEVLSTAITVHTKFKGIWSNL